MATQCIMRLSFILKDKSMYLISVSSSSFDDYNRGKSVSDYKKTDCKSQLSIHILYYPNVFVYVYNYTE